MTMPADRLQAIADHTAVLMHHDTAQVGFDIAARSFAESWEILVPEQGPANSRQGEILRAVGCLATEDRRNGCVNWDNGYEALVEFLRDRLPNELVFNAKQRTRILEDLHSVLTNGREGLPSDVIRVAFGRLIEDAVAYCRAFPDLAPRE
jgi:hypothetical protein